MNPAAARRELVEILVSLASNGSEMRSLRSGSFLVQGESLRLDLFNEALYQEVTFTGMQESP
jgi:hypothetical protein